MPKGDVLGENPCGSRHASEPPRVREQAAFFYLKAATGAPRTTDLPAEASTPRRRLFRRPCRAAQLAVLTLATSMPGFTSLVGTRRHNAPGGFAVGPLSSR